MAGQDVSLARVSEQPPIPEQGLFEVLSKWTGRGAIWDVLAAPFDMEETVEWSAADLRYRAHRVLFERLLPALARWPDRHRRWMDLLPAARTHGNVVYDVPFSGVSWPATRIAHGWPPSAFVGREAQRGADMSLVTALRWTLENLQLVRADATRAYPGIDQPAVMQLEAAATLLKSEPLASASPLQPRRQELVALRREGAPWGAVAEVAEELRSVEASLQHLGACLLLPDDGIRWRLFHLAVLGVTLDGLRAAGCSIRSIRPLTAGDEGPSFELLDPIGRRWELWFEASGIWSSRGVRAPYAEATRGLSGNARALGADLLLISADRSALVIECKYSEFREVVARNGYYQATTYANELRSRLVKEVTSVAIGPEGVVRVPSFAETLVGMVGTAPPSAVPEIVETFLARAMTLD